MPCAVTNARFWSAMDASGQCWAQARSSGWGVSVGVATRQRVTSSWAENLNWVVVSKIFYLTHIFQLGWNRQPVKHGKPEDSPAVGEERIDEETKSYLLGGHPGADEPVTRRATTWFLDEDHGEIGVALPEASV